MPDKEEKPEILPEVPEKRDEQPDVPPDTPVGDQLLNELVKEIAQDTSNYDDAVNEDLKTDNTPNLANDAVFLVASPIKFRTAFRSGTDVRTKRKSSLQKWGAPEHSEDAVLLALRWLKKNQQSDGTWGKTKPAMTSLALLTYLAHAETPESEEFGGTVERALKWLLENQDESGRFAGSDSHEYSLPIAAYALSEAFTMTNIPDVRYAAQKAVDIIVKGQHPDGSWDYNCKQSERRDTSYAGWCIQALKAAKVAELNVEGLDKAIEKAVDGLKLNFTGDSEYGSFGYTSGARDHGLTSVGVLCLQILGKADSQEVETGLRTLAMDKFRFDLLDPKCGKNGLYYWYYTTQAMFHSGGMNWTNWNNTFSTILVSKQNVIPEDRSNYVDHEGQPQAIGFWDQYDGHGKEQGDEFAPVLCALQLEVYYRYLPSYQDPAEIKGNDQKPTPDGGVRIQIII